jgi:hypothetical protein
MLYWLEETFNIALLKVLSSEYFYGPLYELH